MFWRSSATVILSATLSFRSSICIVFSSIIALYFSNRVCNDSKLRDFSASSDLILASCSSISLILPATLFWSPSMPRFLSTSLMYFSRASLKSLSLSYSSCLSRLSSRLRRDSVSLSVSSYLCRESSSNLERLESTRSFYVQDSTASRRLSNCPFSSPIFPI